MEGRGISMDYSNEDDLKQRIGIVSWRNLSKENFIAFASELPNMSEELALKVVEQFPDFRNLVLDSFSEVRDQASSAVRANWKSQKKVHRAFAEYRAVLNRELDRDTLSAADRYSVLRLFKEAIDDEALKDSEHKAFVLRALGIVAMVAVAGVSTGVAVLGGRARIGGDA
ncbi:hypothetical protein C5C42_05705 [Rathayibacter sp. AY1F7]|nr:hypothetical protein C5C42_05705 [Rathayibacter sp. AY1F7]